MKKNTEIFKSDPQQYSLAPTKRTNSEFETSLISREIWIPVKHDAIIQVFKSLIEIEDIKIVS